MKAYLICFIPLAVALSGCASNQQQKTWYKEGATQNDLRKEAMSCRQYGMQSAMANGLSGNMFVEIWIQKEADQCMSDLGWRTISR